MLPMMKFNEAEILAFALVLLRISAFTFTWPVFSVFSVPPQVKVLLSVLIAMLVFPTVSRVGLDMQKLGPDIAWLASKEVLTGLCLGFMTRLFFFAVSVGGNLIATSTGLANGQLFNPSLNATTTTVEQFYAALATLLFLALNGHHFFLTGLAQSFDAIPLSLAGTDFAVMTGKFKDSGLILQSVVVAGIKISAPVLIAMFLMNIVMGIVSRAVPQINVLITSMSVNFLAAILVMFLAVPALVLELDHQIVDFAEQLFKFMKGS